jgi:GNAT superfamily N-acetyltransferase
MIRPCDKKDFDSIYYIINEAARIYRGVIPEDRWKEPYMSHDELQHEIDEGVLFRHAYIRPANQNQGIGGKLLSELRTQTDRQILIGTWAAAVWAIRFYEKNGFRLVSPREKDRLLKKYWSIPDRQVETSVVLADQMENRKVNS